MAKKTSTKKSVSSKKAAPKASEAPDTSAKNDVTMEDKPAVTETGAAKSKATKKAAGTTKTDSPKKTSKTKEADPAPDKTAKSAAKKTTKSATAKKPPTKADASEPLKKTTSVKKSSQEEASGSSKKNVTGKGPATTKRRPLFSQLNRKPLVTSVQPVVDHGEQKVKKLSASFLKQQKQKLLDLRDSLVDQMNGVVRDSLGRGDDSSDSSAFGMHQADAGSDAYDRDFALNILSQEQDALREIEEALHRIESGDYGICQGSGTMIPQARLEAMPFARCTVEYQEKLDREQASGNYRSPVTSLFGLEDKDVSSTGDDEDE